MADAGFNKTQIKQLKTLFNKYNKQIKQIFEAAVKLFKKRLEVKSSS